MNYAKIIYFDSANAKGLSTVLFVSGCTNNCKGCHNPEAQDFNYGKIFTEKEKNKIISSLNNPHIKNFVISGGDPLHLKNIEIVSDICQQVKKEYPEKNIIVYTGYSISQVWNRIEYKKLFNSIDYLIDGQYIKELATKKIDYRGSINQKCWKINTDKYGNRIKIDISNSYFKDKE